MHILKTRRILVSTNTNNIYLNPKKMFYLLIALALAVKVYIIAYFNITNNNKK